MDPAVLLSNTPKFFYVNEFHHRHQLEKYTEGLSGKVTISSVDLGYSSYSKNYQKLHPEKILLERPMKVSENFKDLHKNYWEQRDAREVLQKMVLNDFAVDLSDFQDKLVQITTRIYGITIREKPYEANKSEEQQSAADVNPEKYNKLFARIVRIDQTTNIEADINRGHGETRSEVYLVGVKNKETCLLSVSTGINYEDVHKEIFGKK